MKETRTDSSSTGPFGQKVASLEHESSKATCDNNVVFYGAKQLHQLQFQITPKKTYSVYYMINLYNTYCLFGKADRVASPE